VLGQVQTDAQSTASTALPERLQRVDVTGGSVTLEAMGWQRTIAAQSSQPGGDEVLALQGTHKGLYDAVRQCFDSAQARPLKGIPHR
jgi:predicted transposase YbfD/YdcC